MQAGNIFPTRIWRPLTPFMVHGHGLLPNIHEISVSFIFLKNLYLSRILILHRFFELKHVENLLQKNFTLLSPQINTFWLAYSIC